MHNKGKYNFINIEKVLIKNFSLYSKEGEIQEINENINDGVYCLAGANGLGKTTFLNVINYGLTGIVLQPGKNVLSPGEIIKSNKEYTDRYFSGRINAKSRENAEIEIKFKVNNNYYRFIRGFTDRDTLKDLEIYKISKSKRRSYSFKPSNESPKELNTIYEKSITKDIGIGKFEYFIFFQLYVLTFDENRRMIFWDERASTNAMSISFNYDLSDTEQILELKREVEKLESYAKNARWQATQIKNERERLLKTKKENEKINFAELKKEYDDLINDTEKFKTLLNNVEAEYDTSLKRQNIINSDLLQLKMQYKKMFAKYSEPRSKLLDNEYINYSRKQNSCFLCGSSGHYIVENIEKNLRDENCPLCETKINDNKSKKQDKLLKQLEEIDKRIAKKIRP